MNYQDFLNKKTFSVIESGFDLFKELEIESLFPFQQAIVKWAIKRGRAAVFADTGLGKTYIQTAWAHAIHQYSGNRVLIFAPLCVAPQTVLEAEKMGVRIKYIRSMDDAKETGIYITNYEMIDSFTDGLLTGWFDGVVLDESSIIKNRDSKTRNKFIEQTRDIPYKLSCTATPSPNDFMELGNQAEFLGIMTMTEMLAMFFIHDGSETSKWRLKGHGVAKFWEWLSTWSLYIKRPSDIGFKDDGYNLPPLKLIDKQVTSQFTVEDNSTLSGRNEARRITIDERVKECVDLINADDSQWIVWCNLNDESQKLKDGITGAVEIKGSDKIDVKESRIEAFTNGSARVIVTKPSITGYGLNWQHCYKMAFVGLSDSYEDLYQAIRRCYRFGQKMPVEVYIISSNLEGAVKENIERKEDQAKTMSDAMILKMREFNKINVESLKTEKTLYNPKIKIKTPSFITGVIQ